MERMSDANHGFDLMSGANNIPDERVHFLLREIEDAFFGVGFHVFEVIQNVLIEDMKTDEGEIA